MFTKKIYRHWFLDVYRDVRKVFKRPRLKFYIGPWRKEGNLPIWRHGPIISFGQRAERDEKWNFAHLESSGWNALGKKNHPFLSKIIKRPSVMLPIWCSFYFFNRDIMYKTKWREDDYRYEFPAHITLVIFGFAISVTAFPPKVEGSKFTIDDDYWESILTYRHYKGDLKQTNDMMGYYNSSKDHNFRFRFNPNFLKNTVDRDELVALQAEALEVIKQKYEEEHAEQNQ